MKANAVKYMTPEEARNIEPSRISSMTLHSGSVYYISNRDGSQENEFKEEKIANQKLSQACRNKLSKGEAIKTCKLCGNNYSFSKADTKPSEGVVLRAKKENETKAEGEKEEKKAEETVEVEVKAEAKGENEKKEVLRGRDGKPLLMDIITGKNLVEEQPPETQPQAEERINEEKKQQPQENQNAQQYYEEQQGMNQAGEQQFVPEENQQINEGTYQEQYYNQEQYYPNENPNPNAYPQEEGQNYYPPQDVADKNVQEQYVEPNIQNPNYEEGYMPAEEQYYDQNQGQEQGNMYPSFEDNDNQQYQQPENQANMSAPQQTLEYYPETQLQMEPNAQPEGYPETQAQMEPYAQPEGYPETQAQPECYPETQAPLQQPIEPPSQIQIQPSAQQPIQPPIQQPIQPPNQPGFRPPMTDVKGLAPKTQPKKPVVQLNIGFGLPKIKIPVMMPPRRGFPQPKAKPLGPHGHGIHMAGGRPGQIPHGMGYIQKRQPMPFGPGGKRIVANPIGKIMNNVVKGVLAPIDALAQKRIGLRSTKPTGNKNVQNEIPQQSGQKRENVLRARRKEVSDYYDTYQQGSVLCPVCTAEEYNNSYTYSQSKNNNYTKDNKASYVSQTYQNKNKANIDNFNYHEIVETSDNSKSYVVAKKGGVVVSSDK